MTTTEAAFAVARLLIGADAADAAGDEDMALTYREEAAELSRDVADALAEFAP